MWRKAHVTAPVVVVIVFAAAIAFGASEDAALFGGMLALAMYLGSALNRSIGDDE